MKNKKLLMLLSSFLVLFIASFSSNSDSDFNVADSNEINSSPTYNDSDESDSDSPYTDEQLESNSTAPSTNIEDYNTDGEYKPAEDMNKQEIEDELQNMLGD